MAVHFSSRIEVPAAGADGEAPNLGQVKALLAVVAANPQPGNYTLAVTDAGGVVEATSSSANTVTIPPHSAVPLPLEAILEVFQYGTGQTTIAAGAGVTVRSPGAKMKLAGQYSSAVLRQRALDEWVLIGDLVA